MSIRVLLLVLFNAMFLSSPAHAINASTPFDHVIEYGERLEFYRLSDFDMADSECRACLVPQHIGCNPACYADRPSLTMVCSASTRAISIGPLDGGMRSRVLAEIYRTDAVSFADQRGEDILTAPRVISVYDEPRGDYSIDIEGLTSLKSSLIRAKSAYQSFAVRIGGEEYVIPLNHKINDAISQLLRQCPY
jgi:hypothetical protein